MDAEAIATVRRAGARFSVTARMDPAVMAVISRIPDNAWTPIRGPNVIWEEDVGRWISEVEVAEIGHTALTGASPADRVPNLAGQYN